MVQYSTVLYCTSTEYCKWYSTRTEYSTTTVLQVLLLLLQLQLLLLQVLLQYEYTLRGIVIRVLYFKAIFRLQPPCYYSTVLLLLLLLLLLPLVLQYSTTTI
jgi:hypothetical protein